MATDNQKLKCYYNNTKFDYEKCTLGIFSKRVISAVFPNSFAFQHTAPALLSFPLQRLYALKQSSLMQWLYALKQSSLTAMALCSQTASLPRQFSSHYRLHRSRHHGSLLAQRLLSVEYPLYRS